VASPNGQGPVLGRAHGERGFAQLRKAVMNSAQGPVFYIHIGVPKTATTTIQSFFTMHRDTLLQRGVLYPKSIANSDGDSELHRALSVALEPDSVPWLDGLRRHMQDRNVIASMLEETARTEAKTVVLSAESLAFMRRPETLRRALAPYSARVLVYLRRQDDFLASFYNQLIKSRLYEATFDEFLRQHAHDAIDLRDFRTPLPMCDYERLLKLWSGAFGSENILAGVYEDYDLPAGILRDIAAKMEIDIAGLRPPGADTNPALRHSIVALKRRVNAFLSSEDERIYSERLFAAHNDCAEHLRSDEKVHAGIARRQSILARYREGNARVACKYFVGRSELFDAPNERDSPLPDSREADWQDTRHEVAVRMIARLVAEGARSKKPGS
jgi:hypothetical protein